MPEELDSVKRYGMALGVTVLPRTVLVEGSTDVGLLELAAQLEFKLNGRHLLGNDLAVIAAGEGDKGGVNGVIRELICFRGLARTCLLPNGRPLYRFIGLFDNDHAGRMAVKRIREVDASVLEYKDVFRLLPSLPLPGNLDPSTVQKTFERENANYKGLDWELEDLLSCDFIEAFLSEFPAAVVKSAKVGGKVHRDFTRDGKAQLHRFIKQNALYQDIKGVIDLLLALRFYLLLR